MKYSATVFLAFAVLTPAFSQTTFTDVSAAAGLLPTAGADGIAIADFNNDGLDDIYVNFASKPNQLYKNLGNGTFAEIAQSAGVAVSNQSAAAVWGDIDNDGYPDLYVARQNLPDQLFRNNGDETFTNISGTAGVNQPGFPMAVNMADVNNDGYLDIYVSNFLSENVLYRNNGNRTFINASFQAKAFDTGKSMGALFFDYDQDGDPDLYLVHDGNQPNFLYQNDGTGVFTEIGQAARANTASNGMGVDAGDINNDGHLDLYITNLYENILLLANGDGTYTDIADSAGVDDYGMGWGVTFLDFDKDGLPDIYVANDHAFSPYPNLLYRNLGNLTFEKAETDGPVCNKDDSYGTATFDFNLDGNPDLVVANRSPNERVQLFQNAERPGNWLGIKLLGVQSNRGAVGARLKLVDELGKIHYKELTAGHGWKSQNSSVLHFGLGDAASLQSMTIYWPSGLEQAVDPIQLNQYYTIEEGGQPKAGLLSGAVSGVSQNGKASAGFGFSVFPNPNSGEFLFLKLNLPESSDLELEISDSAGKAFFRKKIPACAAGESTLKLPVAEFLPAGFSGVLLVRVATATTSQTIKLMVTFKP